MKPNLEKLKEAYGYLIANGIVKTQKGLAQQIGMSETSLSSAFRGNKSYLNDTLFRKICDKYEEFNINYFTKNKGEMLNTQTIGEKSSNNVGNNINNSSVSINEVKEFAKVSENFQLLLFNKDDQIAKKDKQIDKKDEQMDRLLTIIEDLSKK